MLLQTILYNYYLEDLKEKNLLDILHYTIQPSEYSQTSYQLVQPRSSMVVYFMYMILICYIYICIAANVVAIGNIEAYSNYSSHKIETGTHIIHKKELYITEKKKKNERQNTCK